MRVVVRGAGLAIDRELREHIGRRAGSALGRFGPKVGRVSVRLSAGGGRAGPGIGCSVSLRLVEGELEVEDSGDEPFEAVSRALDRAGRALGLAFDRQGAAT